ncbi:MAG TPA: SDR family NAD(P)-dependent oxidoreductase [Acidimicrobiales bacterium]|nr:SDR family NAD(P)-dependent oxidoreductase [Acidimicrobiales bacterium]
MREFQGRTAVVTGAASGIGLALCRRFAAAGMRLVMADIEKPALQEAAEALRGGGTEVLDMVTDVSNPAQVDELARAATDAFGPVNVLCNNAGVASGGLVSELSIEDWRWVLGVNLFGVVHGLHSFLPGMLAHGQEAHVVNTASLAGLVSPPLMSPYSASKFAVVAISESLYHELNMTGAKVKVSVLCPGWVNTRIHEASRNRPAGLGGDQAREVDESRMQLMAQVISSGLPPEQVAEKVFEAINEERLYVITHPDMLAGVEARMRSILDQTNPVLTGFFA